MTSPTPRREHHRLSLLIDALAGTRSDGAVLDLIDVFGAAPVSIEEREIGEPAIHARIERFPSGGDLHFQDDLLVAVSLRISPDRDSRSARLADWIDGITNDATLEQIEQALEARARFSGLRRPFLDLGDGYVLLRFDDGWTSPGHLERLVVIAEHPDLTIAPDSMDCPSCSELLVRGTAGVDVEATIAALESAVADGRVTEDPAWVKLADLQALHASGLMSHVESRLRCRRCTRVVCFALHRDSPPTFVFRTPSQARQQPSEPIPPIEQWGSAERVAAGQAAMAYVDREPGAWFLVSDGDGLYLDARYSCSAAIDDSALIKLDAHEERAYRQGGHDYLSDLAEKIHRSAPSRPDSPYHGRDLNQGRGGADPARHYRDEVSAAIAKHTRLDEQPR